MASDGGAAGEDPLCVELPDRLAILPFHNRVLLPGAIVRITCSDPSSVRLVEQELWQKDKPALIGIVPVIEPPGSADSTGSGAAASGSAANNNGAANSGDGNAEGGAGGTGEKAGVGEGAATSNGDANSGEGKAVVRVWGPSGPEEVTGGTAKLLLEDVKWHPRGVAARALHVAKGVERPTGRVTYAVVLQGVCRFAILSINSRGPYHVARVSQLDATPQEADRVRGDDEVRRLGRQLLRVVEELARVMEQEKQRQVTGLRRVALESQQASAGEMQRLADILVASVEGGLATRLAMLDAVNPRMRLQLAAAIISLHLEKLRLVQQGSSTSSKKKKPPSSSSKPPSLQLGPPPLFPFSISPFLSLSIAEASSGKGGGEGEGRERGAAGDGEEGGEEEEEEDDDDDDDVAVLERRMKEVKMPPNPQQPGYSTTRQYLELLSDLPWGISSPTAAASAGAGAGASGAASAAAAASIGQHSCQILPHFCLSPYRRLRKMQPQQPGYSTTRQYLELLSDLPWGISSPTAGASGAGAGASIEQHSCQIVPLFYFIPPHYRRLRKMQPQQPGYSTTRQYLELLSDLPWGISSPITAAAAAGAAGGSSSSALIDVAAAREQLDREHFGLERVKQRILEYIAVRKVRECGGVGWGGVGWGGVGWGEVGWGGSSSSSGSSALIDVAAAREQLDREHFGLERVKQRILEYIAVRKLKPDATGPVLCFVGPPGVGKTSLLKPDATGPVLCFVGPPGVGKTSLLKSGVMGPVLCFVGPPGVGKTSLLKPDATGPVLCFVGPPGVGKTSLVSSIAKALGRKFVRIALGGVKDEADIRGHRRTYVGSMPGRLIEGVKRVGVNNPVMLLDEIDKTGADARGDPAAALLEVLDPEQNKCFQDHYLGVPFDLSRVVFVATANRAAPIPAALLDRMEVIELPGYTPEEKQRIATRHLIPRVLEQHGITKRHLHISDHAVEVMITRYTREAGVRNLSRLLAALARHAAVQVAQSNRCIRVAREVSGTSLAPGIAPAGAPSSAATSDTTDPLAAAAAVGDAKAELEMEVEAIGMEGKEVAAVMADSDPIEVTEEMLEKVLGPPKFDGREAAERVATPGVAVGLVWTAVGGEVQFVEATDMVGKGELHLTGQLGDVIKESAQIALTWVRARAAELFPPPLTSTPPSSSPPPFTPLDHPFDDSTPSADHLPPLGPYGAVPKDGPSAGVTLVTALVSLLSNRCVRSDTAMTGELTLRGLVLPVGGVKEKILAAHRYGIRRVILPEKNIKDLQEVPAAVLACMEVR
ncbi:unnamed protein product [Closterium sp. Naga37s-1]|nr:unnamed protein product [Closterium sp. Naga37s-1]